MPASPPVPRPRLRVGVAIYDADRVLLVEYTNKHGHWWVVPGGGVKLNEGLHDAAIRECREEVCLDVEPGRVMCVTEWVTEIEAYTPHTVYIVFRAHRWSGTPAVGIDPRVHAVHWRNVADLGGLNLYPPIAHVLAANAYGEAEQAPFIHTKSRAWLDVEDRVARTSTKA